MNQFPAGVFCADSQEWRTKADPPHEFLTQTLTFATYNIWFDRHHERDRHLAILEILRNQNADVIALQEVTHSSLPLILQQEWIRDAYEVSDFRGDTFGSYGTVLLSRLPVLKFEQTPLPSLMARSLLTATIVINGRNFVVGNVHLESRKASRPYRAQQLERIFPLLSDADDAVLMGDFNLCSSWPENGLVSEEYADLWPELHDEDGYTEDTHINRMRYLAKGKHKQVRFDRILLRSSTWQAHSIELMGTQPLATDLPDIFPSDHFGLVGKIVVTSAV